MLLLVQGGHGQQDDDHYHDGHDNLDSRDWAYLSSLLAPSRLPLPYSTFHFILLAGRLEIFVWWFS